MYEEKKKQANAKSGGTAAERKGKKGNSQRPKKTVDSIRTNKRGKGGKRKKKMLR